MTAAAMLSLALFTWHDITALQKAEPKTVAEFYAAYKSYGLWLPPKETKLVKWVENKVWSGSSGLHEEKITHLELLVRPKSPSQPATVRTRHYEWEVFRDSRLTTVPPTVASLEGIDRLCAEEWLTLAVAAHHLGWNELAREAFTRGQTSYGLLGYPAWDYEDNPFHTLTILRRIAWDQAYSDLTKPRSNRETALRLFRQIQADDFRWRLERHVDLVAALNRTICDPEVAKVGTTRVVDELVDCLDRGGGRVGLSDLDSKIKAICSKGFDVVPALIDHLDDSRLTRSAQLMGFNNGTWSDVVPVGRICDRILYELSSGEFVSDPEMPIATAKQLAQRWFAQAQKIGEQKWATTHVIRDARTNPFLLRLLATKYPKQLVACYEEILKTTTGIPSDSVVVNLLDTDLPQEDKTELLVRAIEHKEYRHRRPAMFGLMHLDESRFRLALPRYIEQLPTSSAMGRDDAIGWYELEMLSTVEDVAVWESFGKKVLKLPAGDRIPFLRGIELEAQMSNPKRLKSRMAFIDVLWADPTVRIGNKTEGLYDYYAYPKLAVQDAVTLRMGDLLDIDVPWDQNRSPAEWKKLREKVQAALAEARKK